MKTKGRGAARIVVIAVASMVGCGDRSGVEPPADAGRFAIVEMGHVVEYQGPSRGAAWGDLDGDGDADLFVSHPTDDGATHRNAVYRNEGGVLRLDDGAVTAAPPGSWQGGVWVDVDGDRDLDLHIVGRNGAGSLFYENRGGALVPHATDPFAGAVQSASMACWADADNDGLLDVFVVGSGDDSNHFFHNRGAWQMEERPLGPDAGGGGATRSCVWVDVDRDRFPDLVIANARQPNLLLRNRGGEELVSDTTSATRDDTSYSYGLSAVDVNGDGLRDVFVANFDAGNTLLLGTADGRLEPVALGQQLQSPASKGHVWGDVDLDGHLDLYLGSGTPAPGMFNRLWLGQGDGRFTLDTLGAFAAHADTSAAVAGADVDRDGDIDLFVANWGGEGSVDRLYLNRARGAHWLGVGLVGAESNSMGAEAKVSLLSMHDGVPRWQHRWLGLSTGYAGQNEPIAHFGLADAAQVDSLIVSWPSGSITALGLVPADQRVVIEEGASVTEGG